MCQFVAGEDDALSNGEYSRSNGNGRVDPRIQAQIASLEARIRRVEAWMETLEARVLHMQRRMYVLTFASFVALLYAFFK